MAAKKKEIQTTGEVDMGALIHKITNKPVTKKATIKKAKAVIKKAAKKTVMLLIGLLGLGELF